MDTKNNGLYQIKLSYTCAGIGIENNVVTYTAPIFSWMKGKKLDEIERWVKNKNGTINKIN
jgi:hypothetical protein